jgi:hypothetical protein
VNRSFGVGVNANSVRTALGVAAWRARGWSPACHAWNSCLAACAGSEIGGDVVGGCGAVWVGRWAVVPVDGEVVVAGGAVVSGG